MASSKGKNKPDAHAEHHAKWHLRWATVSALATAIATVAAVIAAMYAASTYQTSVDTAKKQLRAYVGVDAISFVLPGLKSQKLADDLAQRAEQNFIVLKVKNFGSTPAQNVRTWINWASFPAASDIPADFKFPDWPPQAQPGESIIVSKHALFPGQSWDSDIVIKDIKPFGDAMARKQTLYLYGHTDYADIYGQNHHSNYCYSYQPFQKDRPAFIPYSRHTDVD